MSRRIIRYTFAERVMHWVAGAAYVYLLITGLAFYSPYLYWLASLTGGGPAARVWHPIIGVLFTLAVVWMYAAWRRDMRATAADQAWKRAIGHYIRNEDEKVPPIGRFNPGQKQLFWLMFYGGILLLLSGLVLWFPEKIPWNLKAVRFAAVLVHVAVALITIGAFIVHVYMGVVVVRGGWRAITRGDVSEAWARAHHRLWLDKIADGTGAGARK